MKDYQRRREGKAAGEPPDPVDDSAIQEPRVIEALAYVLRGDSKEREAMVEKQSSGELEDDGEIGEFHLDVVADRAFVPQTRFGEDNSVGVEWVGRCWVWLTDGAAPTLMDAVVRSGEVAKLLEPGEVRRVRAVQRSVETREGVVDGLEVWMEFKEDPEPDRRAAARGLWEGGRVLIADRAREEIRAKIGTLVRFTAGVVEVDGRRYSVGLRDLEPVDSPQESPPGTGAASDGS
ncbi:MAG: hypothetical protein OXE50_08455 [Chloroflexi bacterium]|nr:hypothetical protein [Chloroflexota bacterium]